MGKKRQRTPEIRSHLVRLRPGYFRSPISSSKPIPEAAQNRFAANRLSCRLKCFDHTTKYEKYETRCEQLCRPRLWCAPRPKTSQSVPQRCARTASEPRWPSPSSCSGAPPNPLPARSPLASSPEPRSSPIPPRVPLQLALIPFPTCFHSGRINNSIHSNRRRHEPLGVGQKRAPALLAHLDHPQQARAERPKPHARHAR